MAKKEKYFDSSRKYSNWNKQLDSYYSELYDQYGETPYWDEFMANPYLNMVYNPKHPNNDYWNEWRLKNMPLAYDYVSKILQRINNTQYDSAAQAVGRERAAGINPDIAGNVGPGDAAPIADPSLIEQPSLMANTLQKTAIADTIINEGFNMIQSIISVIGGAASINGQNINNAIGSAEAIYQTNELFYQNLIDATPVPQFRSDMTEDERLSAYKDALRLGYERMNWNGINRKSKKFFSQGFEAWLNGQGDNFGMERRLMKTYKDYLADRESVVKSVGNSLYKDNMDEMIGHWMETIGDLSVEVQQAELRLREVTADLEAKKSGIDLEAYNMASDDPNYVPEIAENLKQSPSVIGSDQAARIAESKSRIETANTEVVQQQIKREQKKAVKVIEKAFDKAIERVDNWKRFRSYIPAVKGGLKIMKASSMSLIERWTDPHNPGLTEGLLKSGQQAALIGMHGM